MFFIYLISRGLGTCQCEARLALGAFLDAAGRRGLKWRGVMLDPHYSLAEPGQLISSSQKRPYRTGVFLGIWCRVSRVWRTTTRCETQKLKKEKNSKKWVNQFAYVLNESYFISTLARERRSNSFSYQSPPLPQPQRIQPLFILNALPLLLSVLEHFSLISPVTRTTQDVFVCVFMYVRDHTSPSDRTTTQNATLIPWCANPSRIGLVSNRNRYHGEIIIISSSSPIAHLAFMHHPFVDVLYVMVRNRKLIFNGKQYGMLRFPEVAM